MYRRVPGRRSAAQLVVWVGSDPATRMLVDGRAVAAAAGATILEACDAAGRYVPRLCYYPGLASGAAAGSGETPAGLRPYTECGLCVVRLADGSTPLACVTPACEGMEVTTDDPGLQALRRERLERILSDHPHICLSCPDRDGCARDECSYGNPPEARCCEELGSCELGRLVDWLDPTLLIPRRAVTVPRDAAVEGRIRREPALCIGCGRCVRVCELSPEAGRALEMAACDARDSGEGRGSGGGHAHMVARPKLGTLRASGCTFCGRCVLVCPAGALTAPGEDGARWLAGRRDKCGLPDPVFPPEERQPFTGEGVDEAPAKPGVFRLYDSSGEVLRISGVDDLRRGLLEAFADPGCAAARWFRADPDPLFTQRESELLAQYANRWGHLPPGNGLGDDLFEDDLPEVSD